MGRPDIEEAIRRLRAYSEAGADCLYAPRIERVDQVAAIVSAVAPKPVNLLINSPLMTVAQAAELGVRRISVGGTLARAAWKGWLDAATEIARQGTFTAFEELPNVETLLSDPGMGRPRAETSHSTNGGQKVYWAARRRLGEPSNPQSKRTDLIQGRAPHAARVLNPRETDFGRFSGREPMEDFRRC